MSLEYDGLFISNGPGDPALAQELIQNVRKVRERFTFELSENRAYLRLNLKLHTLVYVNQWKAPYHFNTLASVCRHNNRCWKATVLSRCLASAWATRSLPWPPERGPTSCPWATGDLLLLLNQYSINSMPAVQQTKGWWWPLWKNVLNEFCTISVNINGEWIAFI